MAKVKVNATVSAPTGGTLNWAVLVTGEPPDKKVNTMIGDGTSKSVAVRTDATGHLKFELLINAFPATGWELTLTKDGSAEPTYDNDGITDHDGIGRDKGNINFA